MESPLAMDSTIKTKQRPVLQTFDCNDTWADLHKKLNECVEYVDFFRFSQHIYENRINNDVNYLDVMEDPEEIRSGFRYLQSRYNELHRYCTELEAEVDSSSENIKRLKKYGFKQMSSVEKKLLSSMFNIVSESKYLRDNFQDHQFVYIDNLVLIDERLDKVEDLDVLKNMYTYLKQRFVELQKYSLIQESKIEDCKHLTDELFDEFEEEEDEQVNEGKFGQEERVVNSPEPQGRPQDRAVHSPDPQGRVVNSSRRQGQFVSSPEPQEQFVYSPQQKGRIVRSPERNRRVMHSPVRQVIGRNTNSLRQRSQYSPDLRSESLSPTEEVLQRSVVSPEPESSSSESGNYYYESDIEEDPTYYDNHSVVQKPRRDVMPEHVAPNGLQPIPTHVYSPSRVAPESNVKIFKEKKKSYSNIGSTGYGKCKPRRSEFNKATILPPVQSRVVKRLPNAPEPQQSMHSEYELVIKRTSIKGIVKPSLLNKDILRLRDPTVRVRGAPKQQQDVRQELNKTPILPSISQQRGSAQTGAPQNQFAARQSQIAPPQNQFAARRSQIAPPQNQFSARQNQIAPPQNQFATRQSQIAPPQNQFEAYQNQADCGSILPRIPQPPAQPKQQYLTSRIPRLPSIQQQPQYVQSRIPQPPKGERLRFIQRRITRFQ